VPLHFFKEPEVAGDPWALLSLPPYLGIRSYPGDRDTELDQPILQSLANRGVKKRAERKAPDLSIASGFFNWWR